MIDLFRAAPRPYRFCERAFAFYYAFAFYCVSGPTQRRALRLVLPVLGLRQPLALPVQTDALVAARIDARLADVRQHRFSFLRRKRAVTPFRPQQRYTRVSGCGPG